MNGKSVISNPIKEVHHDDTSHGLHIASTDSSIFGETSRMGNVTQRCVEEMIRFIKQSYDLEDVRVLTYQRLQAIYALVLAASFFAAVYVGASFKLELLAFHVLKTAKCIFGIPDFRSHALTDGIKEVLSKARKGILADKTMPSSPIGQVPLFRALQ
jgi:hypothetical protein